MTKKHDTEPAPEKEGEDTSGAQSYAFDALVVFDAMHRLALAQLHTAPTSPTAIAWRELANACAAALGIEEVATATPIAGRPAAFIPPARRGAVAVPHKPPLAMPPRPRAQIPIGGAGGAEQTSGQPYSVIPETPADIRKREDVAAEIERVRRGGK